MQSQVLLGEEERRSGQCATAGEMENVSQTRNAGRHQELGEREMDAPLVLPNGFDVGLAAV